MNVEKHKWYTIELCRANPEKLFIFGCNLLKKGMGGQAQIRNEPNSYGIPTKKFPSMSEESFFTDNEYEFNIEQIKKRLDNMPSNFETIVLPTDGLGTGLAELPKRAPRTYKWLIEEINKRFGDIYEIEQ